MKKLLYITVAALVVMLGATSCKQARIPSAIEGEWHYESELCDIYISFDEGDTFQLFQKLGQGRYYQYNGSWTVDGKILSGTYNDGTPWGSSYEVKLDGESTMTLTATNGSKESITYIRTTIPDEVLDESVFGVRAGLTDKAEEDEAPKPFL